MELCDRMEILREIGTRCAAMPCRGGVAATQSPSSPAWPMAIVARAVTLVFNDNY